MGRRGVEDPDLLIAVEIAAIDFHGFTNLCHKEIHL